MRSECANWIWFKASGVSLHLQAQTVKLMPFIGWNELDPLSRDALTSVFLGISCSLNNNAHEMGKTILQQNALILVPSGESDDHVVPLREHWLLVEGTESARSHLK